MIPSSMAQNVYTSFACSVHGGSNAWNQETTCCEQGHNVACKQSTDFGETACGLPLTLLLVFHFRSAADRWTVKCQIRASRAVHNKAVAFQRPY